MALGSLLLQPQALQRLQSLDEGQAFGDDLVALLQQCLVNPERLGQLAPVFERAFAALGERLRGRLESRLEPTLAGLRDLLAPLLSQLEEIGRQGGNLEDAADALKLAESLLGQLEGLLESLSEAQLRTLIGRVHSLLSDTLGLDQALLREELRLVFTTLRTELLNGVGALETRTASIHLALAAFIGRLEREFFDRWPTLDLSPDRLAQRVMQALKESGFEKLRAQLSCLVEKLRAALGAGGALLPLIQPSPFGPGSVGAAQPRPPLTGDTYCWYASWLYATRRQGVGTAFLPGYPADEVWLSEDKKQLILRRAFSDDEVLHQVNSGTLRWNDAPQFTTASGSECFTFNLVGPEFMETWTKVFAALVEFSKGISHIVACATSPKEYAANIPLAVWNISKSVSMGLGGAPLPSLITRAAGWGVGSQWLYIWVPWLSVILGSLEGKHTKTNGTNIFLQWVTLLGGDALSAFTIHGVASGAHDALLSFWTLANYGGPAGAPDGADTRPLNRDYGGPLIGLSVTGANWLLMKLIPREDYAYPFMSGNDKFYLYWLLCAPLMGVGGGLLGTLLVWAISRTYDWGQLGKEVGLGALRACLSFIVQEYSTKEGDTDDGKYNPKIDPLGVAYADTRDPFAGYPEDAANSPYLLPYEKGTVQFVGQANQGMFSHMRFNYLPQIYAYDFSHDFGDEVLASRAGTVVDFFDWVADDINPDGTQQQTAYTASEGVMGAGWRPTLESWNFIIIRHDTVSSAHDKGMKGNPTTTYAVYGHGKTGSIRAAFNARGVAPGAIIGTAVKQGQVIMLAGDTGMSFHNHLHMHVLGSLPTTPATVPVRSGDLTPYTLPFVFKEARHIIGRDGVLKNLTWYQSDNEKVS